MLHLRGFNTGKFDSCDDGRLSGQSGTCSLLTSGLQLHSSHLETSTGKVLRTGLVRMLNGKTLKLCRVDPCRAKGFFHNTCFCVGRLWWCSNCTSRSLCKLEKLKIVWDLGGGLPPFLEASLGVFCRVCSSSSLTIHDSYLSSSWYCVCSIGVCPLYFGGFQRQAVLYDWSGLMKWLRLTLEQTKQNVLLYGLTSFCHWNYFHVLEKTR